ncbi:MAG: glycosyltransferase family 4 protein [Propionibacteriaceae bacterium]|nr:glycosyltransferase family 4 protein [Propionibacteriaceae bacterium]
MDCAFLVPGDLPGPSGGTIYNTEVIAALIEGGHRVQVHAIPGAWPRPTGQDRWALETALSAHPLVVVDGIMALAAPEEVASAARRGTRVHILIHSLLTADPSLGPDERSAFADTEGAALRAASSCSASSEWSASDVRLRCPGALPRVVRPGTVPAPPAGGSDPPQMLVLAALTPVKNQQLVLQALHQVSGLEWSLRLVGSDFVDPGYARQLRRMATDCFAPGRVTVTGALTGSALEDVWATTDLLLLTSTSETFGMVITEGLSRGIPAVVAKGTGAVEALLGVHDGNGEALSGDRVAGAVVPARNASALAHTLRCWLSNPETRAEWRAAALARRPRLQTWTHTAAELARILKT